MFLMSAEDALARAGTTAAVTPTESPKLPLALCSEISLRSTAASSTATTNGLTSRTCKESVYEGGSIQGVPSAHGTWLG